MTDSDDPQPPQRRARRHWSVWLLLLVGLLVLVAVLGFFSFTGRPIVLPDALTQRVERAVNERMAPTQVSLGEIVIEVERNLVPRVRARNVGLIHKGAQIARIADVRAVLTLDGLKAGQFRPDTLRLTGGEFVLRRGVEGRFDLAAGAGGMASDLGAALDAVDGAFDRPPLDAIKRVEVTGLTVTLEDARSGRLWQVTDGAITLDHQDDAIEIAADFDVFNGTEELAETRITFRRERQAGTAEMGVTLRNARATDIGAQSPALSFLSVLDAPLSGAMRVAIDAGGKLDTFTGALEIGAGALAPQPGVTALAFTSGKAYFDYDPDKSRLSFSQVSMVSDLLTSSGRGHVILSDFDGTWPQKFIGQFTVDQLDVSPQDVFEAPLTFDNGMIDLRLGLAPFSIEMGQASLGTGAGAIRASGHARVKENAWDLALDLSVERLAKDRLMALWPLAAEKPTRDWLAANMHAAEMERAHASFRHGGGAPDRIAVNWDFTETDVTYLKTLPPVTSASGYATIADDAFTLVLDSGDIAAPQGGDIDVAGSVIAIPDLRRKPAVMEVALRTDSAATAAMSLLNEPPFRILRSASIPVDVAQGRAEMRTDLSFPLKKKVLASDVVYATHGTLRGVVSDKLLKGRLLAASELTLDADPTGITIAGPVRVGVAQMTGRWRQDFGKDHAGRSQVTGQVVLDQAFLDEFDIFLPPGSVSGAGTGALSVALQRDQPPVFTLTSDLTGLRMRLDALGWSKGPETSGTLSVSGTAGGTPEIDALALSAAGLRAEGGRVIIGADGLLDRVSFDRLRVADWLDAPVVVRGQGRGQPVAISTSGGTVDIRKTRFGTGGGEARASGESPLSLVLDRLTISSGIDLTDFKGTFTQAGGFAGTFSARINGQTPIAGTLRPSANGPVISIAARDAGGAMGAAGIIDNASGGDLALTLVPTGATGTYDGTLKVTDTRFVNAPAMAELLSAVSVVGLLEQLGGPGIVFTEVDADFRLDPNAVTLLRSSAVGPSLGFSLDGTYDLASRGVDMQGVVSPVYFLNGIGQVFTRRGEGLFGFNFRLTGAAEAPKVSVNPLSILTPGLFREIFRRPPPTVDGQ